MANERSGDNNDNENDKIMQEDRKVRMKDNKKTKKKKQTKQDKTGPMLTKNHSNLAVAVFERFSVKSSISFKICWYTKSIMLL